MAGDLGIMERAVIEGVTLPSAAVPNRLASGPTVHRYGRLSILAVPDEAIAADLPGAAELGESPDGLNEVEQLGLAALQLRESEGYRTAKRNRPRAGERWDMPSCITAVPGPRAEARAVGALSAGPTSAYLEGSVAVGIIIVQGPTADFEVLRRQV